MMMQLGVPIDLLAVLAQAAPTTNPATEGIPPSALLMMVATMFLFYWFMIRPANLKQKELDALIRAIKPGDKVVTTGGIVGLVMRVRDTEMVLKVDEKTNARLTVLRSHVLNVLERASAEHKGDDDDKAGGVTAGKAATAVMAGQNPVAEATKSEAAAKEKDEKKGKK